MAQEYGLERIDQVLTDVIKPLLGGAPLRGGWRPKAKTIYLILCDLTRRGTYKAHQARPVYTGAFISYFRTYLG